jgi:4-hydroxy-tetrahydrodipicolinate synthase
VVVEPELLTELAVSCGLDGGKLSGTASLRLRDYVAAAPQGFEVYSGNDRELADVLAAVGHRHCLGCSAALPEPFLDLAVAIRERRMDSRRRNKSRTG